jgi:ABC-type nitrate/sulfonate/bicarbonate transport system permease component
VRPAALFVLLIGLWEAVVRLFDVQDYVFPAPTAVARSLYDDRGLLASATGVTVREVALGYLLAVGGALLLAIVLHFFPALRRALLPLLILSSSSSRSSASSPSS